LFAGTGITYSVDPLVTMTLEPSVRGQTALGTDCEGVARAHISAIEKNKESRIAPVRVLIEVSAMCALESNVFVLRGSPLERSKAVG